MRRGGQARTSHRGVTSHGGGLLPFAVRRLGLAPGGLHLARLVAPHQVIDDADDERVAHAVGGRAHAVDEPGNKKGASAGRWCKGATAGWRET